MYFLKVGIYSTYKLKTHPVTVSWILVKDTTEDFIIHDTVGSLSISTLASVPVASRVAPGSIRKML